jgi:hypothetical protein
MVSVCVFCINDHTDRTTMNSCQKGKEKARWKKFPRLAVSADFNYEIAQREDLKNLWHDWFATYLRFEQNKKSTILGILRIA